MNVKSNVLNRKEYRPDIDGLRAIAIISVIIFHAFPSLLSGGFVGVDVFFLISGFLISTIIFQALDQEKFSFLYFYTSRVKRIFPALIFVLTSVVLFGWFTLFPVEFQQLGKHLTSGLSFIDNVMISREGGYFDISAELKPLLHLWSLCIEEQFYLGFPFIAWLCWRFRFNYCFIVLLLISILSFLLNIRIVHQNSAGAFFLSQARIWELLTGCMLAYATIYGRNQVLLNNRLSILLKYFVANNSRVQFFKHIASVVGLLFLVMAVIFISQDLVFPGYLPLYPLTGTALLIIAGPAAVCNRYILSHPYMVGIGLISYPLYLWHWPILSLLRIIHSNELTPVCGIIALICSFALAVLTYVFIEKPIRFGLKKTKIKIIFLCLYAVALSLFGLMMFYSVIEPRSMKLGNISDDLVSVIRKWEHPNGLHPDLSADKQNIIYRIGGSRNLTLFIGDSNMEQYSPRIVELFKERKNNDRGAIFLTEGGCVPIPNIPNLDCAPLLNTFINLANDPHIDRIVFAANWFQYLGEKRLGKEGKKEKIKLLLHGFEQVIQQVARPGRQIYLVLNIPVGPELDPINLINRDIFKGGFSYKNLPPVRRSDFINQNKQAYYLLQEIAKKQSVTIIDPLDFLCKKDRCSAVDKAGKAKYMDFRHLQPIYVKNNVHYMDQTILG